MSKNKSCDVLVIGSGLAGCCAAIEAHASGANVLMIEKAPADIPHGNTAFSGGAFRRTGADYPPARFFADLIELSDGRADRQLARILVDESAKAQEWLEQQGARFGLETAHSTETAQTIDRGRGLAASIRKAVADRSIPCRHRTEALSFIREDGRVAGITARQSDGSETELRADATILATGGFSANQEMVTRYIGAGARNLVLRGSPFNTGDGLRMAEAIGAPLEWMDDFHGGLIHYGYKLHPEIGAAAGMRHLNGYEYGLLINRDGVRFVDEGENILEKTYVKFGKTIALTQPGGFAFVVYDAQCRDKVDPVYAGPDSAPVEAPTLAALAAKIDVPEAALLRTVASFNAGVRDGKNLDAKPPKSNFARRVDTSPFFAHKVTGGFTFTFGGVRARPTGEVLDAKGEWITGLFAAGEITTGIFYGNYAGGSSLPKCTIFGRMAGVAAARYAKHAAGA